MLGIFAKSFMTASRSDRYFPHEQRVSPQSEQRKLYDREAKRRAENTQRDTRR